MLERLTVAGERRAAKAVAQTVARLAAMPTPPGVTAEPVEGGVLLSGRGLRRRTLGDPKLRNFGQ